MGVVLHHPALGHVIGIGDPYTGVDETMVEPQVQLHEARGWVRVPDEVVDEVVQEHGGNSPEAVLANVKAHLAQDPHAGLDALKKDDLVARVEAAQLEVPPKATKQDLIDLLTKET